MTRLVDLDGSAALRVIGWRLLGFVLFLATGALVAAGVVLAYGAVYLILKHAYGVELPNPAAPRL